VTGSLNVDLKQHSRHGDGGDGDDKGRKPPIRGTRVFAVIRPLKIGHREAPLSRSMEDYILAGASAPALQATLSLSMRFERSGGDVLRPSPSSEIHKQTRSAALRVVVTMAVTVETDARQAMPARHPLSSGCGSYFDDFCHLMLAPRTLKTAPSKTGFIWLNEKEPHWYTTFRT
jgi:hypothetical protein